MIDIHMSKKQTDDIYDYLYKTLERKQYDIYMFWKIILQPRLISFFWDIWVKYTYSKTSFVWSWRDPVIYNLKEKIEHESWYAFNSVLCNLYRDWNDSMWRHSDDEKELWSDPVILSISLWQERMFHLRNKLTKEKIKLSLSHWSCLLMWHGSQIHWQHAIMKSKRDIQPRINLTFRNIVNK